MKMRRYTALPTHFGDSGAPACMTGTIKPWAAVGAASRVQVFLTGNEGAVRLLGPTERTTV